MRWKKKLYGAFLKRSIYILQYASAHSGCTVIGAALFFLQQERQLRDANRVTCAFTRLALTVRLQWGRTGAPHVWKTLLTEFPFSFSIIQSPPRLHCPPPPLLTLRCRSGQETLLVAAWRCSRLIRMREMRVCPFPPRAPVYVCDITGEVDSREFSSVVRGDLESRVMSEAAL